MYQEGGVGDGVLHLIGDVELLLGHGLVVRQGVENGGEAGNETAVEVTHPQQSLDVQLGH